MTVEPVSADKPRHPQKNHIRVAASRCQAHACCTACMSACISLDTRHSGMSRQNAQKAALVDYNTSRCGSCSYSNVKYALLSEQRSAEAAAFTNHTALADCQTVLLQSWFQHPHCTGMSYPSPCWLPDKKQNNIKPRRRENSNFTKNFPTCTRKLPQPTQLQRVASMMPRHNR